MTPPRLPGDLWEPEPWGRSNEPIPPAPPPVPPADRVRPPVRRSTGQQTRDRSILGIAVTHATTAIVAFGASIIPALAAPGGWPLIVAVVVVVLLVGIAVSRDEGATLFTRGWVANLVTTIAVMPLTALTVTLARQPHVALTAGSAWAPILMTGLLCAVLLAIAAAFAFWSADGPDEAGLLVLPAAMIVPAIIGVRGEIDESSAAQALAQAAMISSIAALMSWSVAPPLRAFAPPIALGLQVVVLWLSGHGPSFTRTSGQIVPLLFSVLFAVAVAVVVGTSILAIIVRQLERDTRPFGQALDVDRDRFGPSRRPPLR